MDSTVIKRTLALPSLTLPLLTLTLMIALVVPVTANAQFNLFGGEKKKITLKQAAAKKKLEIVEKTNADIDGDGTVDTVAACRLSGGQLALCIFGENDDGAVLKHLLPKAGGKKLRFIKTQDLLPEIAGQEIMLEVYDETPDEKVKRVRVYAGHPEPREIFTSVIFRSKNSAKRANWEQPGVVKYGDARAGWYFFDMDDDGKHEILVRRRAKVISVKRRGEDPAKLLVGVNEAVFEYTGDPSDGSFQERGQVYFNDFLQPGYDVAEVRSSSTYIQPSVLAEMQSEALAAAVYGGDDAPAEVKVDRAKFTERVADKSTDTAWIEDGKGIGADEWVELVLDEPAKVHMVRIVPGCLESKREYRRFNVPTKLQIQLDGKPYFIDLRKPDRPDAPVLGMLAMPLPGKKWAKQYLVFFEGDREAKNVKVMIESAKRQGNGKNTCIAEVSVH